MPQIGGPINCSMPLTNKLIPYELVSRSVPNISAIITAVIPTYVPEARPNSPHQKLTILYDVANGSTDNENPDRANPPTKYLIQ